jgi:hypothetical protein
MNERGGENAVKLAEKEGEGTKDESARASQFGGHSAQARVELGSARLLHVV